jgi:predicted RNA methylase
MANVPDRRSGFGDNWLDFARDLHADQIEEAEKSLCALLQCDSLTGRTFIDVGSGRGLFSLAARKLGAKVHSFDFDPQSVRCTVDLRERFFSGDPNWTVGQGSILDPSYHSM